MIHIRQASEKDIPALMNLLSQVLEVHAVIRPDLFVSGTRKYTEEELREILADPSRPVFVAEEDGGPVAGYCFCVLRAEHSNCGRDSETLYIDDLCVDETCRGRHIGADLFDFVKAEAKRRGCYHLTLNVWEGNSNALAFYQKRGLKTQKTVMEMILDPESN